MLAFANQVFPQYKVNRVVIDAGHGGKDPGAIGSGAREKDITLAIALKTGKYIEENLPDVEVIYTRKSDEFVELYRRAKIANDSKADLFISIHCNAVKTSSVYGTETYVMGLHRSEANLEVAKLENAAILQEENYSDMYEGFNPNEDEDYITLTMFQDAFLEQSTLLAEEIQNQFRERVKLKDRGVFQAGFLVLYRTAMPGVLIETGFISNPRDLNFMKSEDGQVYIASAIYRAVKYFKQEMERADNKAKSITAYEKETREEKPEIVFRVQFMSSKARKELDSKKYKELDDLFEYEHQGLYKYTTGKLISYDEALRLQDDIRSSTRYKDAFVVAFREGQRISIDEALDFLKK